MNKLLLIPRAIMDVLSIWNKKLTSKEKSSLTYTLVVLKLKKWLQAENAIITFPVFGHRWKAVNNEALQFLVKEVFVEKVYQPQSRFSTVADIGANIGLATLYFKMVHPGCQVKAFEPNESSYMLLAENISASQFSGVETFNRAVAGTDKVLYQDAGFALSSINQTFSAVENAVAVKVVAIKNVLNSFSFDCVKMDIEGMEYEVLAAAVEMDLVQLVPYWMIEFHDAAKTKTIVEAFAGKGFVFTVVQNIYHFKRSDINNG